MANGVIDYSVDPHLFYTPIDSYYNAIPTDILIYPANTSTTYSIGNYKFGEGTYIYSSGSTLTSVGTFL